MAAVLQERQDGCVRLRLSRGAANALTTDVMRELTAAIEDARRLDRGVMLCGGDKFFSNGVDVEWALAQSGDEIRTMFLELGRCLLALLETPVPVVGVAKGHAIGAALAMLLACDYRYAATGRVLLGKPEILLGVPNPYYGDQLLRFIAGDFVASDLIYTGALVTAEAAHDVALLVGYADIQVHRLKHAIMQTGFILQAIAVGRDIFGHERQIGDRGIQAPARAPGDAARIAGAVPGRQAQ